MSGSRARTSPGIEIDWPALRRRLDQVRGNAEGVAISPERRRQILRDRARAISARSGPIDPEPTLTVIEFWLVYEKYAVEMRFVREIAALRHYAPLPGAPEFVLGVVNLRGRIVSVVDLKRFFDLPDRGLTDLNKIIVLQDGSMEFGILADAVIGVRTLQESSVQPPLPTLTGIRAEFSRGVTPDAMVVLHAQHMLSDKRLVPGSSVPS
jgi:purine-binding chemotaxis protein CheW